jgi:hypothetical protein
MSADRFGNDLRALVADPAIAGIVIDINCPGGCTAWPARGHGARNPRGQADLRRR